MSEKPNIHPPFYTWDRKAKAVYLQLKDSPGPGHMRSIEEADGTVVDIENGTGDVVGVEMLQAPSGCDSVASMIPTTVWVKAAKAWERAAFFMGFTEGAGVTTTFGQVAFYD